MNADDLSRIAMSSNLGASLARGAEYARQQGHIEVTLEHMLLSLCEDPDAGLVLAASNIDLSRLMAEVSRYLAGLQQQMPPGQNVTPAVSGDLRRILDAAAAAARGGRRREINGAIVLAAIVGDGKSPAAHLLRDQGLTFEGAIRALQRSPKAGASPRSGGGKDAEDILADARARVQSRTVPPRTVTQEHPPAAKQAEPPYEPEPAPPEDADEEHEETLAAELPPQRPQPPPQRHRPEPAPEAFQETFQEPPPPEPPRQRERLTDRLQSPPGPAEPMFEPQRADEGGMSSLDDDAMEVYAQEEAGPQTMPASAPFPPPLPVPEPSWMPPPGASRGPPPAPPAGGPMMPPPPPLPSSGGFGAPPPPVPSSDGMAPPPPPMPSAEAPWPHPSELRGPPRSPPPGASDDRGAGMGPLSSRTRGAPQGARPPAPGQFGRQGPTPRAEIGQLVENIPRVMRVAVPAMVEVRIARGDVQALAEGLQGGGAAFHHQVSVTKAMSVRLRAPDGGFFIETASPETQWIEKSALMSGEDYASWRWHVTPREKGRKRLQLVISARTVSTDGLTAETALPDQVITVRVRTNYGKVAARWSGWVVAAIAGGLLARFGDNAFDTAREILTRLMAS